MFLAKEALLVQLELECLHLRLLSQIASYLDASQQQIEIWRFIKTKNAYGEEIVTSEKVRDTRAKVAHLSGSRTLKNNEIQYPYNKQFVLRIHEQIDEDMLIKWEGHFYRVLSIDRNRDLQQTTCVCEVVNE